MSDHPYKTAPARAFWSRSVSNGLFSEDLINSDSYLIRRGDKIVSAGSCFASNLVPYLEKAGLSYIRTENFHRRFAGIDADNLGYSKFSAAYGNIYTIRQLLQLLRRASGVFKPAEDRWLTNGAVIDPFRPGLRYPARTTIEFDALTTQHLSCVRRAFSSADVFVLTLGLTEAWVSRIDGAVFPACPGTVAGEFDPDQHEFKNFSVAEISADLASFISELRILNPKVRFIITVSPVPLVATATGNHVLCATIYSKSVLRVAAQEASTQQSLVTYFPAYEIVMGPQAPRNFLAPDRRNVTADAVDCVMATLLRHCETSESIAIPQQEPEVSDFSKVIEMECEELMAER